MKYAGFCLIILGVLALVALFLVHFTIVNTLTAAPLFFIIIGVVLYVWGQKRESQY